MDESDKPGDSRASKDARDWVIRLASGAMTDAELARFRAWRDASAEHAEAFARERMFWRQIGALDPRGVVAAPRKPQIDRRRLLLGGGAAAAAASIAIVAAPRIKLMMDADYRTAPGEQAEIALPDGSRATLNTDSALALRFAGGQRSVELLRGEALFDVKARPDTWFRVAAFGGHSEARNASFAVRAVDETATVIVTRDEVRVAAPAAAGSAVTLRVGQETSYARDGVPNGVTSVDIEQVLAWRSGRVIFDGRRFADALTELGRYVREPIVLANRSRADDPVSAIFSIRQAGAAIEALAQTQGLTARRIPGVAIVIT